MKRNGVLIVVTMVMVLTTGLMVWAVDPGDIALPSGTQLLVKLTNTLSTKGSEEGDPWAGKVEEPIFAEGQEVVPVDSTVRGHVTFVKPAGRATGRGEMRLVAETISVTGRGTFTIVALLQKADDNTGTKVKDAEGTVEGPGKSDKSVAKEAGIGAAGGAAVGGLIAWRIRSPVRRGHRRHGGCNSQRGQETSGTATSSWDGAYLCPRSNLLIKTHHAAATLQLVFRLVFRLGPEGIRILDRKPNPAENALEDMLLAQAVP